MPFLSVDFLLFRPLDLVFRCQSDEDLALKQQLELYVERVQDAEQGVQKLALESMRFFAFFVLDFHSLSMNIFSELGFLADVYHVREVDLHDNSILGVYSYFAFSIGRRFERQQAP